MLVGPVVQRSLVQLGKDKGLKLSWPNDQMGFLRSLEGKFVAEVGELMHNTLKDSMATRKGSAKSIKLLICF